jgi:outer membrane protein assembly factor BamB
MLRACVKGFLLAFAVWVAGGASVTAQEEAGGLRWCYAAPEAILFAPAISKNGTAFIATDDQNIRAVSPSGLPLWAVNPGGKPTTGIAFQGGLLFFGTSKAELAAYATNGHMAWRRHLDSILVATPAVSPDGTVYAASLRGTLYAVNPRGRILWSYPTGDDVAFSPVVARSGRIYVASTRNLFAFEPGGQPAWIQKLSLPPGTHLALDNQDGICYVDTEGNLHLKDSHGNEVWKVACSMYAAAPVVAAGTVFVCEGSAPPPPTGHAISGTITLDTGGGLSGVTVSTSAGSDETGSDGKYSIHNLADGTYTVTPTLAGYTFDPETLTVKVEGADVADRNFVASASEMARNPAPEAGASHTQEDEAEDKVVAYSLEDGTVLWEGSYGSAFAPVAADGGGVLIPSNDYALNLFDSAGEEEKEIPLDRPPQDVTLATVKGRSRIYVVCGDRFLTCIDTVIATDPLAPWGQLGGLPSRVNRRSDSASER